MGEAGRLIYRRRTGPWIWLPLVILPILVLGVAFKGNDLESAILPVTWGVLGSAATMWIAIGWAGRTRLSEVWLDGDILLARRGHALDRGKILRIPLSETHNWKPLIERYGSQGLEVAEFDHQGITYTVQTSGADYVDLDLLNAWMEEWERSRDGRRLSSVVQG